MRATVLKWMVPGHVDVAAQHNPPGKHVSEGKQQYRGKNEGIGAPDWS